MSPTEWGLVVFFGLWFGVSAFCQIPSKLSQRIQNWDLLSLIPSWNFFAPTPSTTDLHLLVRDRLADGRISEWREIPRAIPPKWINPLWNPGRRYNKALFDVTKHLAREVEIYREKPELLKLSIPYIAILNFVSGLSQLPEARETQFLLMSSKGRSSPEKPITIFVSGLHALEEPAR